MSRRWKSPGRPRGELPWAKRGRSQAGAPSPDEPTSAPPATPPESADVRDTVSQTLAGLFGRDTAYTAIWLLQIVITAASTPLVTRVLPPEQFGQVAVAAAVMQVLVVIAGCGLQTAIQRCFAEPGEATAAASRLLTSSLLLATAVTALVLGTMSVWSPVLGFSGSRDVIRLAAVWAGLTAVSSSAIALLRSQDRLRAFTSVSLLQSVGAQAIAVTLVLAAAGTAEMMVLGQVVGQFLAAALALTLARPRRIRRQDTLLVRNGLAYALPLVPAMLGDFVLGAADRIIVQHQLGAAAVGQYQIAYSIGQLPTLLLWALDMAWLPRFFTVEAGARRDAVLAASRDALYRLVAPVMVGLSLGAPLVLRLWAPPEYGPDELNFVTALVIVGALPYTAALSVTRDLITRSKTGAIAVVTCVTALANVAVNLALIPYLGLVGAALATVGSYALMHGLLLLHVRGGRQPFRDRAALAVALAGAALALVVAWFPVTADGLVIRATLAIGCLVWFGQVLIAAGRPMPGAPGHRR